jgi:hypothetical protein
MSLHSLVRMGTGELPSAMDNTATSVGTVAANYEESVP